MENKPDFEKLEEEFNNHRLSIFTTKSSAPVLSDWLWFKEQLTSHVLPLQKDYVETKDRNIKLWEENNSIKKLLEEKDKEIERLKAMVGGKK